MGRRPTPSTQCGPKAHTLCSPSLSEARGAHSVTQVIRSRPTLKVKVSPLIEVWVSTSGVSKVGEGPRSAGTRHPPDRARITHPGPWPLCVAFANHSQHVEERDAPLVLSLSCHTRAVPSLTILAHTHMPLACVRVLRLHPRDTPEFLAMDYGGCPGDVTGLYFTVSR